MFCGLVDNLLVYLPLYGLNPTQTEDLYVNFFFDRDTPAAMALTLYLHIKCSKDGTSGQTIDFFFFLNSYSYMYILFLNRKKPMGV